MISLKSISPLFMLVGVFILGACGQNSRAEAKPPVSKQECENQYKDLKNYCASKQDEVNQARGEIEKLKKENEILRQMTHSSGIHDPTWEAIRLFIEEDKGDEKKYDIDRFNCQAFALELRDHARDLNMRGAYVIIEYEGEKGAHAINAFETLDHGLIYIEPQGDQIAYVKIGKEFGTIPINAVKRRIYACPKTLDDFSQPLETDFFQGKLFEYEYYVNYLARSKCYEDGNEALNASIEAYNKRVRMLDDAYDAFNRGQSHYTQTQLSQMGKDLKLQSKKLDSVSANLKTFRKDLGEDRSPSQSIVSKVKSHWN